MAVTVDIPIDLRTPAIAGAEAGNAFWTVSDFTNHSLGHWEYVLDVDGSVFGWVGVPLNMAATPNAKIILYVSHPNATTGEVTSMQVLADPFADGEAIPTTALTSVEIIDFTMSNTANVIEQIIFPSTGSMTAPVAGDQYIIQIRHDGNKAADTLTENTRLHSAYLRIDLV
jgi:hypothetical protein